MRFSLRDALWLMTVVALASVIYWEYELVRQTQTKVLDMERERNQAIRARDYYKREYGQMFKSYLQAKLDCRLRQ